MPLTDLTRPSTYVTDRSDEHGTYATDRSDEAIQRKHTDNIKVISADNIKAIPCSRALSLLSPDVYEHAPSFTL